MVLAKGLVVKLLRWDRIYLVVFVAAILAVAAYAVVVFAPLIHLSSGSRISLLTNGNTLAISVSLVPVLVAGFNLLVVPKRSAPGRSAKISLGFSTLLMYLFVLVAIWSVGMFFTPAAILMTAAAVASLVPRRERTVIANSP
jgi:hypothetical protein